MNENVSRRSFLKTAGAGVAGMSTVAMAQPLMACAAEDNWDEEFDIVIVGAGIAGLTAAATVITEAPGTTCLLIRLRKPQAPPVVRAPVPPLWSL